MCPYCGGFPTAVHGHMRVYHDMNCRLWLDKVERYPNLHRCTYGPHHGCLEWEHLK